MITSQLLRIVRNRIADGPATVSKRTWSDRELMDSAHTILCSMFRDRADAQEGYHNCRTQLAASLATRRNANVWEYRLPSWVHSVYKVRETKASTESDAQAAQSVREDLSDLITGDAWRWSGSSSIYWYSSAAKDLTLDVAKRPARPLKGTCDLAGTTTTINLVDDASVTDVEHEFEVDAYKGEQVVITARPSGVGSLAIIGQARVVESSARVDTGGAVYRTRLTFQTTDPFGAAIAIGHTYESVIPVEDPYTQFLVLRIIEECGNKTDNVAGLEAIKNQLRYEWAKWETHLRTRDRSGPRHFGGEADWFQRRDPDRDPYFTVN